MPLPRIIGTTDLACQSLQLSEVGLDKQAMPDSAEGDTV